MINIPSYPVIHPIIFIHTIHHIKDYTLEGETLMIPISGDIPYLRTYIGRIYISIMILVHSYFILFLYYVRSSHWYT